MLPLLKLLSVVAVILLLTACNDLLSRPLASANVPESPKVLVGDWSSEDGSKQLTINKDSKQDWYGFHYLDGVKKTEGRFVVSYFKNRMVFNVDLASVRINNNPIVNSEVPVYMLFGAIADEEELRITPAQMDKFEKHFSKYFFASPMNTKVLCAQMQDLCASSFESGNLLLSKRMRKFNDDLVKKFRTIFPNKQQVTFVRV